MCTKAQLAGEQATNAQACGCGDESLCPRAATLAGRESEWARPAARVHALIFMEVLREFKGCRMPGRRDTICAYFDEQSKRPHLFAARVNARVRLISSGKGTDAPWSPGDGLQLALQVAASCLPLFPNTQLRSRKSLIDCPRPADRYYRRAKLILL